MTQAFIAAMVFRFGRIRAGNKELVFSYDPKSVRESYLASLTGHGVWPAEPYPLADLQKDGLAFSLPFEIALKHKVRKRFLGKRDFSSGILGEEGRNGASRNLSEQNLKDLMSLRNVDSIVSDTGEILSDKNRQLLLVDAPCYKTITGRLRGKIELGSGTFSVDMKEQRYGSVSLLALDSEPVPKSHRLLLLAVARVRNTGMKWDETKHYVAEWGRGPVLCENVPARVTMAVSGNPAHAVVWALDGGGKKIGRVPYKLCDGKLEIEIGGDETVWYFVESGGGNSTISK